jgi:nucleotidyltransferase/DNA polymerase involved in DNA repair
MTLACVLLPRFQIQVELSSRPALRGRPVIITTSEGGKRVVLDASVEAEQATAGMPLQEAIARCPDAVLVEPDHTRYHTAFEAVLDGLNRCSPVVEGERLGLAYVGLDGLEGLYGGEEPLIQALFEAIPPGLHTKVGVAGAKFPAYLAALSAGPDRYLRVPPDVASFLARFPVDVLPLSWEAIERLRSFGLVTLGDVAALPLGPLQAQFGPEGKRAWELARGVDRRHLTPRSQEEQVAEALTFPTPVVMLEPVLLAVETLLGRAFARPQMRGRYARAAVLRAGVFRGAPFVKRVSFRQAVGGREQAFAVIKSVLASVRFPGPLEDVSLTLRGLTGEPGMQASLFREVRSRQQLGESMKQLEARLGERPPVYRVREVEPWSRIPERRRALVPYAP